MFLSLFSVHLGQFNHGNVVRGLCFLSLWGIFFHGYDIRLCFQYIWANFILGMMSGGLCFLSIWGLFFHGYAIRLCFLAIWANILSWE
jgi:hypothetical protein